MEIGRYRRIAALEYGECTFKQMPQSLVRPGFS